ncbi:MAG: hypothetical protein ACQEVA_05060 [Myxococcota bacterium]
MRPSPFVRDVRYHVGNGAFARIDPTGFGVNHFHFQTWWACRFWPA